VPAVDRRAAVGRMVAMRKLARHLVW
jgi:hypothetical protein